MRRLLTGLLHVTQELIRDRDFQRYGVVPTAVIITLSVVLGAVLGIPV